MLDEIVKIDVGGYVFKSFRSTLEKSDGFFKQMLKATSKAMFDESGAFFIDRDPTHFRLILNFMRDGHVELPETEKEQKEILKKAEYYSVDGLMKICEEKIYRKIKVLNLVLNLGVYFVIPIFHDSNYEMELHWSITSSRPVDCSFVDCPFATYHRSFLDGMKMNGVANRDGKKDGVVFYTFLG
ncbi:hypothetical protein L5515_015750 [Caenorhabditis briggsae]|uniref:BTB domain-containing protein n=1 Tax=Caenorhabditis briggsae TaxID=6238 RepID=A0AAE9EGW8_CAEBR|nr:hypothetical protein L5515_015750 [Caenorhabditis briggsae]